TKINSLDRVESVTINPTDADQMYVTTEADGLWITNNLSSVSPSFSQITTYPFQHPVRVFFNPFNTNEIWITSFGNGMRMGLDNNCSVPDNLIASGITSTAATVTWDAVPGATSYKVTKKVVGGGSFNYSVLTNSISLTGLTPGSTNKVTVKAKCGALISEKSERVTIHTPLRTGITNDEITLYPNPAGDIVYILIPEGQEIQYVEIFSVNGVKMKIDQIQNGRILQVDTSQLPDGFYIINVFTDKMINLQLVIRH
ncbi:MAG: T9SS type A sorting domain-containing protein, partial [Chitinophagales bacterium]|nr:T9SS type A sorting domain-containing protein [Chitinophagales bacterium]